METTLQLLLDERAVTQVLHRYATALDQRDWLETWWTDGNPSVVTG